MIQSVTGMGAGMTPMQGARPRPAPQELFDEIDADGDGTVSATELQSMADHMAERMGDNAPTVEDLMAQLDSDSDGAVSFAEFEAGRPQNPPFPQGSPGALPAGMQFGSAGQMDLSQLFDQSDEDYETLLADRFAYA